MVAIETVEALGSDVEVQWNDPDTDTGGGVASKDDEANDELKSDAKHDDDMASLSLMRKKRLLLAWATRCYGDRQMKILLLSHIVATLIVWYHFGLQKYTQKVHAVPLDDPFIHWKRLVPALEFGSMHVILFQMALLPLTMCRHSISVLAGHPVWGSYFPWNRLQSMHIYLGYFVSLTVILATIIFFTFFGRLCAAGDQAFCAKFSSEIMITGYVILISILVIAGTSFYRFQIPYSVFYVVHHLVFLKYFVTVMHTLDVEQRSGTLKRSQTFIWFTASLGIYLCDRLYMNLHHCYNSVVEEATVTASPRNIHLSLTKPAQFWFRSGQYVYIQVGAIDQQWHPFSIVSSPDGTSLEFLIQVRNDKTTWTSRLASLLEQKVPVQVKLMGPYGTPLPRLGRYSHVLAVASGTGIVPLLSLYKQHVNHLLRLDPEKFDLDINSRKQQLQDLQGQPIQSSRGSILTQAVQQLWKGRTVEMPAERHFCSYRVQDGERVLYEILLLSCLLPLSVVVFGINLSWNTLPIPLFPWMIATLKYVTVGFHVLWNAIVFGIREIRGVCSYLDVMIGLTLCTLDWFGFLLYNNQGKLDANQTFLLSLFHVYIMARLWGNVVSRQGSQWRHLTCKVTPSNISTSENMTLIWTTRSALQVLEVLPEIQAMEVLLKTAGWEKYNEVYKLYIYVTDQNKDACRRLEQTLTDHSNDSDSLLTVSFHRCDMANMLHGHSERTMQGYSCSHSLLAFCGSPQLGKELEQEKLWNDLKVATLAKDNHVMDILLETHTNS
eukprot:Nitzschia sp. Nitz4//scaffold5_size260463//166837//169320//NITZ4_000997-RA/size260463-exonerate_est2genome-gene-0.281-mRNA-1//1//CDS//3329555385//8614//frame0